MLDGVHVLAVELHVPGGLPTDPPWRCAACTRSRSRACGTPPSSMLDDSRAARTVRVPEHQPAARLVLDVEQVQRLAQLAVVALLGLLELLQVRVQVLLLEEGGAVDALQHGLVGVAAPVGTRGGKHLHVTDALGGVDVRSPAQVHETAHGINGDRLTGDVVDEFELVALSEFSEVFSRTRLVPVLAGDFELLLEQLVHAFLDAFEVFGRERLLHLEVIVEPVVDGRADGELRVREQLHDGVRQHVRRGMPQQVQALLVGIAQCAQRPIAGD